MSLVAYPPNPRVDGSSLLVYGGPPNVAVEWTLTGSGTIAAMSAVTDARGVAGAVYTPGTVNDIVTVSVRHGT